MSNLIKKISVALIMVMMISMLPAKSTMGANRILLGVSKEAASETQEFTLDIDDTEKWSFYGAKGYTAADAKTKVWTSSNPDVVEVVNGKITAKAIGTAIISLTVTANGVDYYGSAKVTVRDENIENLEQDFGLFKISQTSWNAVTLTFPDNKTAVSVNRAGVKAERVKISEKLGTEFYLYVNTTSVVENEKIIITGVNDGVTYRFTVPGIKEQPVITMHVGEPTSLKLSYDIPLIGENKDILGNTIKKPVVTPSLVVYDERGIICNVDTRTGVKYTAPYKFGCNFAQTSGKITFRELEAAITVRASLDVKRSNGVVVTLTDEITIEPDVYKMPNLQGFVEQICLTNGKKNSKIKYPAKYTFEAAMSVGEANQIAYYFLGSDGQKYAGSNIRHIVEGDKTMAIIDPDREFYFIKDNEDENVVSVAKDGRVIALKEGKERICLYECRQKGVYDTINDMLVGILDVTVSEEPKPKSIVLIDPTEGEIFTNNGLNNQKVIAWEAYDQYDDPIAVNLEFVDNEGKTIAGALAAAIDLDYDDIYEKYSGTITIDYSLLPTSKEPKDIIVRAKYSDASEVFTIDVASVNPESDEITYEVIVPDFDFLTAFTIDGRLDTEISVAKAYDGNRYEYVGFNLISDPSILNASLQEGCLYVQIEDSEGNVLSRDAMSDIATSGTAGAPVSSVSFVAIDIVNDHTFYEALMSGSYHVTLYALHNGVLETEAETEFSVLNSYEGMNGFSPYKMEIKNGKVQRKEGDIECWRKPDIGTKTEFEWVCDIASSMQIWADIYNDGKAFAGFISTVGNLADIAFVEDESKWVLGANGTDIYIKSVTFTYTMSGHVTFEQTYLIDKRFETNGCI